MKSWTSYRGDRGSNAAGIQEPTVGLATIKPVHRSDQARTLEVNIFDFEGDLYGKSLDLQFLKRLRHEQKFSTREALLRQLQIDRSDSLACIAAQSTVQASS